MDIKFEDLSFRVSGFGRGTQKHVLKNISGIFKSGQLTGILGPSGAGKSSLLNVLSRYRINGVTGKLDHQKDVKLFNKLSCYIPQDDLHPRDLTLHEVMMFAARLKMPTSSTEQQQNEMITNILSMLNLKGQLRTRTENLSGGQRKRLSIAVELISNPPIFFLDEPTTGLDIVSSSRCTTLLKKLAQQNRTIICTVHTPSAKQFLQFDHVYILAEGLCVYQGPADKLVNFLSSVGLSCPLTHNPADFIMEMADKENMDLISLLSSTIKNGSICYNGDYPIISKNDVKIDLTELQDIKVKTNYNDLKRISSVKKFLNYHKKREQHTTYPVSGWKQFYVLLIRMLLQISRNKMGIFLQLFHALFCGVLIGIVFLQRANDANQMFLHLKFCVSMSLFETFTYLMIPILTAPAEIPILKREHFNRWYHFASYYFAMTFSKIPILVLGNAICLPIVYALFGLPFELTRFFFFCLFCVLTGIAADGLGLLIGSTFEITNGAAIGPACLGSFLGLAMYGFDTGTAISGFMNTIMGFSFMRSSVVGLVLSMYGMERPILDCSEVYCHFRNPKTVLKMIDIDDSPVMYEVLKLTGLLLAFRLLFYIALKWRLSAR